MRWDDGSGRIPSYAPRPTSRPKGRWWPVPPTAMRALDAIRPMGVGGRQKVFGLSESQIARRVKAVARPSVSPVGRATAVTAGASAWPAAWPRTARPPTRSRARAAGSRAAEWSAATLAARPPDRHCGIYSCSQSQQNIYSEAYGLRAFPCACGARHCLFPNHIPCGYFNIGRWREFGYQHIALVVADGIPMAGIR